MKTTIIILAVLAGIVAIIFFTPSMAHDLSDKKDVQTWRHCQIQLPGAGCIVCIRSLDSAIRHTSGVIACRFSVHKPVKAVIIYDATKIKLDDLLEIMKRKDQLSKVIFDLPESKVSCRIFGKMARIGQEDVIPSLRMPTPRMPQ